jgi:DNA-binding SARP family transcriptional activator
VLASGGNASLPLVITKDSCQLAPGTIVDAIQFEDACFLGAREIDPLRKFGLYLDAVPLYRSDLLPLFDAPWLAAERARLSQCFARALFDLADAQRQLKDYSGSEKSLGILLEQDPLSEECHIALMRLYAELGQPTRVQRQLQAMEGMLKDGLGIAPTAGSLKLAEELREEAGSRAAEVVAKHAVSVSANQELPNAPHVSGASEALHRPSLPESHPYPARPARQVQAALRSFRWPACLVVAVFAIAVGLFRWKALRSAHSGAAYAAPVVQHNKEKWAFYYQPRSGEKPDSEGRAIVQDGSGAYVTGLIQTYKDDTDILTLKLSEEGKLVWVDRYSSPEHDCDRANSLCLGNKNGLYVAGQTYVPDRPGVPGGWHLTLLRYDRDGHKQWVSRSPLPVQDDAQFIKVCSDGADGCYICGTALEGNKTHSALVIHYNRTGRLLWQRTVREGKDTEFHGCAVASDGTLYICGRARVGDGPSGVHDNWLTACMDATGKIQWRNLEDSPVYGSCSADRVGLDQGGNALVGGVFNTGDAGHGGHGNVLGLVKYSPDGSRLWRQIATDSGPNVCLNSVGGNFWGNADVGGTEQHDDGTTGIIFIRYDSVGNHKQTWRYPMPVGYKSASLSNSFLWSDESIIFVGQVSKRGAMHEECSLLFATCSREGKPLDQFLFEDGPGKPNSVADFMGNHLGFALTGQVGLKDGKHELVVLQY